MKSQVVFTEKEKGFVCNEIKSERANVALFSFVGRQMKSLVEWKLKFQPISNFSHRANKWIEKRQTLQKCSMFSFIVSVNFAVLDFVHSPIFPISFAFVAQSQYEIWNIVLQFLPRFSAKKRKSWQKRWIPKTRAREPRDTPLAGTEAFHLKARQRLVPPMRGGIIPKCINYQKGRASLWSRGNCAPKTTQGRGARSISMSQETEGRAFANNICLERRVSVETKKKPQSRETLTCVLSRVFFWFDHFLEVMWTNCAQFMKIELPSLNIRSWCKYLSRNYSPLLHSWMFAICKPSIEIEEIKWFAQFTCVFASSRYWFAGKEIYRAKYKSIQLGTRVEVFVPLFHFRNNVL